jgi:hypothetical protein
VLSVFLLLNIALLLFQYRPVQTWAAKKVAASLSQKLKTEVSVGSLYIKPFSTVVLRDFYVLDRTRDTLIKTPKLQVGINGFSLFNTFRQRHLDLTLVQLDNASVYLKDQKDGTSNIHFILEYFKSTDTTKTKKYSKPWKIDFDKVVLNNTHFRYKNQKVDTLMKQVNFDDVDVRGFSTVIKNMDLVNHLFKGNIERLTLKENKSGFYLRNLSGDATVDTNQILVRNMHIQTGNTDLKNYFHMKFKSFDDFNDIEDKVYMDGDFKNSRVSSNDIAYFTDGLNKTKFDLGLDGRIRGYVNNLKAKNLLVTGAQSTYVKGDFSLKGLPDWENTFLELNFQQIATNKKDLDYLYSNFSGTPTARVPDIISKFGEISFSGKFTGLQNDFVAYGSFKTRLGRFDPDLNLKIHKNGLPSYSGKIATKNFDLGTLIDVADIGRTSLTANVSGSGDALKNLNVKMDGNLSYIHFRGYDYSDVTIDGSLAKKIAKGHVNINDKYIALDANGSVDMNPGRPVYNFDADVNNANLHVLKLLKDTVTLSGKIKTDFSGLNINDLQGKFLLSGLRIVDPRNNYTVDSVYLSASGKDASREIDFKSDMADGTLKGNYDLATLPSYFKTIVKKYIPSLQMDVVKPNPQNFTLNFNLRNIDPLLAFFVPNIKVPDGGVFIGHFDSESKTAEFNGLVKTIQYGTTIFHDLIIDESTTDEQLGVNISLSRINITDSLLIKNIDITNFVRKDSLNFNIKLADKDATNQLDLYGLVQFAKDTTARLKLLPSDVILEHQKWRLNNQVRVRVHDNKTEVSGFELTNGTQTAKINGLISGDQADQLKVEFQKFSMGTFDQLTKTADVKMRGTLNGDVVLTSVLKSPSFDAHLGIDSFAMNKTLIGNVKIASTLDTSRTRANMMMNIVNRGLETMNIDGSYLLGKSSDESLNFNIKMNQTEAIIFEPFIKDLVSNLKGTISSDLKLTGALSNPQFNGSITLENTGVTVNYLKTAYTINQKVNVANSVINIDNLALLDNKGGKGIANGKVDLNDLPNPDIEIDLDATNLMALNTTFKDNHLYFGTAYATGRFSFSGPTDNMNINIKAKTNAGTVFNIPLNTSTTTSDYEFIRYVNPNDTTKTTIGPKAFHGITLNFDLSVDEKTTVKIATSYGKLEGTGIANNMKLTISSLGDFNMYGDYLISSGKFEFVAKNVVSKNFDVTQGGTIRWTGDPVNSEINMRATYETRTDVNRLYQAAGLGGSKTGATTNVVLVQTQLILTKSLLAPVIDFDFNFPTDPSVKDDLGPYLTDETNKSQQAISVIVTGSFLTGQNNLSNQAVSTASNAFNELFFSKLNTIIAQSNAIKNLDLNIRSFSDASASLRLWNQRFVITGSLYSSTLDNSQLFYNSPTLFNSANLSKDFSAQYLILKNGNLNARYSYRLLNSNIANLVDLTSTQYVNALGLVYQRDFDTFGEFFRNIFRSEKNKKVNPLPEPKTTPKTPPPTPIGNDAAKSAGVN